MKIAMFLPPEEFKNCFNSDGHMVFERLMENHILPISREYYFSPMTEQALYSLKGKISSKLNELLPVGIACDVSDIELTAKIENGRVVDGTLELAFHQPLLGILSSLQYVGK